MERFETAAWSSLTGLSSSTETCRYISKNSCFQSYFAKQRSNFGRNAAQMDRFDSIGNFVSIEQCLSIFSW